MIWIVFALLTEIAVFSILWPLWRPASKPREDAADVAFYRAQIVEINAEVERGVIDKDQAQAANALAARRLMAAATQEVAVAESPRARNIATVLMLLAIPAVALGLYASIGRPGLPDMPLMARLKQSPAETQTGADLAGNEKRIAAHPDDGHAYEMVAPAYLRTGRYSDAVHAREQAIKLLGETPERLVRYAEALAYAADDVVRPEAEEQIARALALDPKFMEARYFLALGAAQHDDASRARKIWSEMLAELPEDSQLRKAVKEKLALLDTPEQGGPASSSAAAIAAEPPDQQRQTIQDMVDRLAQKLASHGGGPDEWTRLIRTYSVMKEPDKAQAALADARKASKDDAAAQQKFGALARELGLERQ